jgi:hypothetical protein
MLLGFGLMFVALAWWHAFQRQGRATGTVTRRPPRHSRTGASSTDITFTVGGQPYTVHPSVITNFDAGKLEMGAQVPVTYDESDPSSADIAEPWRMDAGSVIATVLYVAFVYVAFFGGGFPGGAHL